MRPVARLFVYGTLRPAVAPDAVRSAVSQFVFVGAGTVRGKRYQFTHYPGLVLDDAANPVRGEVYELPDSDEIWSVLDAYEGVDSDHPERSLFARRTCTIRMDAGGELPAFVYEFNATRWK
jgi:gamma-glutamylcyclotransferase (GGCT)/AIG2-like uncharacterized protein YtfP